MVVPMIHTKQVTIYPQPKAEFLPDPQVQDFNTATDSYTGYHEKPDQ